MAFEKIFFSLVCFLSLFVFLTNALNVSHDGRALIIDGQRRILISGSIHYPRSTPAMWPDLIQKAKEGGLNTIETYVFWNAHEPVRRQYDFSGNNDLVRFLKTVHEAGLYAILRIGPYVCAEWNYGGFPVWLHNLSGVEMRTANNVFMNEMQNFTTVIINKIREEKLLASQGGPIIIAQIENEFGNVMDPYGDDGKVYIDWCASMAESYNIGVPWIMRQQSDAPQPMINTCNGYYCDQFTPNNPNSPKIWTENWVGWFKSWGGQDPHRTAEDVAYGVARFYQTGGTLQNYYMYHGGTNFGRTAGGPYITTSYDYDAPLDEFGNIAQPKWGHLKKLHEVLKSIEKNLVYGNVKETDLGNSVKATVYALNGSSSVFLSNSNTTSDATFTFNGKQYAVPAWSVSILPDGTTEEYNTAKINVQTSVNEHWPNEAEKQPESLKWVWRPENIHNALKGKSPSSANKLIDQKEVTSDSSDYLWYINSLQLGKDDPVWSNDMSLRINASGQVIHAYLNGHHIGNHWAKYGVLYDDEVEFKIKLNKGKNVISLLSVTTGLQNYGSFFDTWHTGLVGPIEVVGKKGDETILKDLSSHKWHYKIGLDGWDKKFFSEEFSSNNKWASDQLPINRSFTWYKTTFKAPLGKDPVVVDLEGLGKGYAWVNGNNIGRYWPAYLAAEDGCSDPCDYRGEYSATKCISNCGKPSQKWYHVPRSFLKDGDNTLVLLEEMGGNPSYVNFRTVSVGTACGNAYENNTLELSCQSRPISAIKFASFGDPQGTCGSFYKGTCESSNSTLAIIEKACVGKQTCSIDISENTFGLTNCGNITMRLAVEAIC